MVTNMKSKTPATPKAEAEAPKAVAPKLAQAIEAERAAIAASVEAVTALESRSLSDLVAAYRLVGSHVIRLAELTCEAKDGRKPVASAVDTWPKLRAIVWPKTPANGVEVAGRSESVVQRGVKLALYVKSDADMKAWETARTTVTAKAKAPKATPAARDAAKHTAYTDGGLKGLTAWAEARADKRIAPNGAIRSGSNRNVSPDAKARDAKVADAVDAFATAIDPSADPTERDVQREAIVVGSITVGMLSALSLDQLRILAAATSQMIDAKRKAPKATTEEAKAPVLSAVPDVPAEDPAEDPLAGVSADTLATLARLLDAGKLSVSA